MKTKLKILFPGLLVLYVLFAQSCCYKLTESGERIYYDCPELLGVVMKAAIRGEGPSWKDPLGFQAGTVFPVKQIMDPMTLRSGALISFQGSRYEEAGFEGRVNLWYAYVPVTLRYQHSSGFYGEAGLQPGFLISAKDVMEIGSTDYMDFMHKFDLSLPIVIGYKLNNKIGVHLRIVPGINDITKDEVKDRNLVMGAGLTYNFEL
jgi:hypothetical protein